MGRRYDAEEVSGFMGDLCSALNGYKFSALDLELAYNKYANNGTFKGVMAETAKGCIDRSQRRLHKENLVIQNKVLSRFKDTKDLFEDMVDSSPKARIDTDILESVKKDFQGYRKVVTEHGANIENIAEYLQDNFSEECDVDFTQPSYQDARDAYSAFSGPNGYIDKTIKKFEEFDTDACEALNKSGIKAYIYDYQQALIQTGNKLLGIDPKTPEVDDTSLNAIATGAAVGAKAMVANAENGENGNTTNLSILDNPKVDKWLSPDYKLTPEEVAEARKIAVKEFDSFEKMNGNKPDFQDDEDKERYEKACALYNKCSPTISFGKGLFNMFSNAAAFAGYAASDIIFGGVGEIGATMIDNTFGTNTLSGVKDIKESFESYIGQEDAVRKLANKNAKLQNSDAYETGNFTAKAILYFLTEGYFASVAAGLKVSEFAATQVAENLQDLMLDTTDVYNGLVEDGNLSGSDWAVLGSNVLLNAMNNLAFAQLNEVVDLFKAKYAVDPVVVKKVGNAAEEASDATKAAGKAGSAKGLVGCDFEEYLTKEIGGNGSFSVGGREFDGGLGNRWWEAKSGQYWDMLEKNPSKMTKFKSDMGDRLRIAEQNGASYELFSNTPIPDSVKTWLTKKGIVFTEILD
ncbi:hypothetical protein D6853_00260 [Butyrivibrio sp. X503]|uniref:hypothetical protein n=1 Tax=Butyrivibrio sp. X503 TaxID=2364878 RepID=UPI000EAAC6AB|nr:hypothetical protein [Butyrivibrio sp. X503]RKM58010.1 hypothetical protein D6853_00260 [Butyrivibrio sp. X503]